MLRPDFRASGLPTTAARPPHRTTTPLRARRIGSTFFSAIAGVLALAACNTDRVTAPRDTGASAQASTSASDASSQSSSQSSSSNDVTNAAGVVYTLSNQVAGNAVLIFRRAADGSLAANGSVATNGTGTGAGLGSQNALVLSRDGDLLFAVNPGSNTVSSFTVADGALTIVSTVSSGGLQPISLTAAGGLLYVLNAGGSGNIAGLRYNARGVLTPIANSARALSSSSSAPAQVEFSPAGDRLIVTEKGTSMIASYKVGPNGVAAAGAFTPSSGTTPFGFAFHDNLLVVSEAFGGAANASATSSYELSRKGTLSLVSGSVPTTETAACWVAVLGNGKFAYVTNTGSGTVTGYAILKRGALERLTANGETAVLGAGTAPSDMAFSAGDRFLYARNGGTRAISVMRVHANGALTVLAGGVTGLPAGTAGLAAR